MIVAGVEVALCAAVLCLSAGGKSWRWLYTQVGCVSAIVASPGLGACL